MNLNCVDFNNPVLFTIKPRRISLAIYFKISIVSRDWVYFYIVLYCITISYINHIYYWNLNDHSYFLCYFQLSPVIEFMNLNHEYNRLPYLLSTGVLKAYPRPLDDVTLGEALY